MTKEEFFDLLTEELSNKQIISANDVLNIAEELFYKELYEKIQGKGGKILFNKSESPIVLARCFEEIVEIEVTSITVDNNNNLKVKGIARNDRALYWLSQDDLCPGEFRHLL